MAKPSGIPILSFFTGGGFLDLGFREAGFQTIWSNEYNQDIADMFEHGMTSLSWSTDPCSQISKISSRASISDLDPENVRLEAFGRSKPKCFGVIGGPPCPDFSVGGKNRGATGDHGKLSKSYIDMICSLKPHFFVMENVPGLIRTSKHRTFLESLRNQLRETGYITDLKILNALEFGVPQDRERIFMVGLTHKQFRKSFKNKTIPEEDGWFPYPKPKYPNAKDLPWPDTDTFGMTPKKPAGIIDELTVHKLLSADCSTVRNADEAFNAYSPKISEIREGDDSRKSFKRLHRYRYSPTACYGNNEVHLHPWEPRRLTVREALRIQTIPDGYVLPANKSLSIKFKMIGNGVPRVLAKTLGQALYKALT